MIRKVFIGALLLIAPATAFAQDAVDISALPTGKNVGWSGSSNLDDFGGNGLLLEKSDGTDLFGVISNGNVTATGSLSATSLIASSGNITAQSSSQLIFGSLTKITPNGDGGMLFRNNANSTIVSWNASGNFTNAGDINVGGVLGLSGGTQTQVIANGDGGAIFRSSGGVAKFSFDASGNATAAGSLTAGAITFAGGKLTGFNAGAYAILRPTGGNVAYLGMPGNDTDSWDTVSVRAAGSYQFATRTKLLAGADGALDIQTSGGTSNLSVSSTGIITTRPPAGRTEKITIDSYTNNNDSRITADRRLNLVSGAGWDLYLTSSASIVLTNGTTYAYLTVPGNNILSQVNGANAQEFRVANTTNEHAGIQWFSGVAYIGTNVTSGGTHRAAVFGTAGAAAASLRTNSTVRWDVGASDGHLTPAAATTYDVGSASLPVRDIAQGRFHTIKETATTPTAATDTVVLYAKDNGSGKTQLMALFPSGAAVQIGIEP